MLGRRGGGGRLRAAAIQLFNRSTASSSSSKLFVGGLSYDTNETALKDAFSGHGDVIQAKVICHPTTGKSKGYGFVKFSSQDEAAEALQKMNGQVSVEARGLSFSFQNSFALMEGCKFQVLDERNIRVQYANSAFE